VTVTARLLLLDEMYPPLLAEMLRDKGHDVLAVAASTDLTGADDANVLDAATTDGRCLVTENVRDFALLARHAPHAGTVFANARRWPRTREGISRLAAVLHDMISNGKLPGEGEVRWLS
jgi:hypothetical protein